MNSGGNYGMDRPNFVNVPQDQLCCSAGTTRVKTCLMADRPPMPPPFICGGPDKKWDPRIPQSVDNVYVAAKLIEKDFYPYSEYTEQNCGLKTLSPMLPKYSTKWWSTS